MGLQFNLSLVFLVVTALWSSSQASGNTTNPTHRPTNSSSSKTAPTKAPSLTCEQRNSTCGTCTDDSECYWCGADSTCKKYPVSKIIPGDCKGNKWFWKQCFASGYILIIVIPSVCGVILLAFGCCIYCCCCRNRSKKGYEREEERSRRRTEERQQRNEQRRTDRKERSDAIRQKYGLLSNEDEIV